MRLMAWLGCGRALLIALFAGAAAAQSGGVWTFTDNRDGKKYKVVTIGSQMWTAENLNYQPQTGNSWCYGEDISNCGKYGMLYDWKTALEVCFPGWHLPTRQEWDDLVRAAGGNNAAKKLKARLGWSNNGNGTNEYFFSAAPAGRRGSDGVFEEAGKGGYWWTSSTYGVINAYARRMRHGHDYVYENVDVKRVGRSVRCIAD